MQKLMSIGVAAAFLMALGALPATAVTMFDVPGDGTCGLQGSNFGLRLTFDGAGGNAFLKDDSPTDETRHIVRVRTNGAGITMAPGDNHQFLRARDPGGSGTIWRVHYRRRGDGVFVITLWAKDDTAAAGDKFIGEVFNVVGNNQCFQIDWQAATSAVANDGVASIKKCAGQPKTKVGRDNFFVVNQEQLGAFAGPDPGTTGFICYDNFEARRAP